MLKGTVTADTTLVNLSAKSKERMGTLLYVQGVGRNIDLGVWEKLGADEALPGFDHTFVWQNENAYVVGLMWSSSDGKGRKRYPMVLVAHALGVSLHWILAVAIPRLETLRRECEQLTSAPEVGAALDRSRIFLNEALAEDCRSHPHPRRAARPHPPRSRGCSERSRARACCPPRPTRHDVIARGANVTSALSARTA